MTPPTPERPHDDRDPNADLPAFHEGDADDRLDADSSELLSVAIAAALEGTAPSEADFESAHGLGLDLQREIEAFEDVAASLAVALDQTAGWTPMPPHLHHRLRALGAAWSANTTPADPVDSAPVHSKPSAALPPAATLTPMAAPAPAPRSRAWPVAAGIALGASGTLLALAISRAAPQSTLEPASFLAAHPSAVHWSWIPTGDPHAATEVRGEAYFDPDSEVGVLEIDGLAVNDPAREQYQLWIFDADRDERYPVDGGVFDISRPGRVLIPVEARLPVSRPTMFAVTVERPGGAVVSERQIAILAKP